MDKPIIYLDFSTLKTLAQGHIKDTLPYHGDQDALKEVWDAFKDERIGLVTSGQDMEMEIIMWLNNQGCCVTDTLTPLEAIEEFERWEGSDREQTRYWRRIFFYFEQLNFLPQIYDDQGDFLENLISLFSQHPDITEHTPDVLSFSEDETRRILRECAGVLKCVFPEQSWHDLRHIDYSINWKALGLALNNLNIEPVLHGDEGVKIKRLFGLLNRVIGLGKKSSKNLPMEKGHTDFIIDMVMKKYFHPPVNSHVRHISNCFFHNIDILLTTDYNLVEGFSKIKERFNEEPGLLLKKIEVVSPLKLKTRIGIDKLS
ncbi:MAG: hypothetical protein KBE27_00585 [Syntrophorhabdaceae bacterium]|nr:hypothetical protein [Syntrophorhabdaceae bacterium]